MATFTNNSKTGVGTPFQLNIGDGFQLSIGSSFELLIQTASGTFTNETKN